MFVLFLSSFFFTRHANSVLRTAREWKAHNEMSTITNLRESLSQIDFSRDVFFRENASSGSFLARDNVCNFIQWCRRIRIKECLLFETEDLVARKNEKSFVLCLLEVARYGAKFGECLNENGNVRGSGRLDIYWWLE